MNDGRVRIAFIFYSRFVTISKILHLINSLQFFLDFLYFRIHQLEFPF